MILGLAYPGLTDCEGGGGTILACDLVVEVDSSPLDVEIDFDALVVEIETN